MPSLMFVAPHLRWLQEARKILQRVDLIPQKPVYIYRLGDEADLNAVPELVRLSGKLDVGQMYPTLVVVAEFDLIHGLRRLGIECTASDAVVLDNYIGGPVLAHRKEVVMDDLEVCLRHTIEERAEVIRREQEGERGPYKFGRVSWGRPRSCAGV